MSLTSVPKIQVKVSDFDYNVQYVVNLLSDGYSEKNKSLPFRERVLHTFPLLANKIQEQMTKSQVYEIIKLMLEQEYADARKQMEARIIELKNVFNHIQASILPQMLALFEIDWPWEQKEITCYLGLYPVFPRDVITKEYWIHYKIKEEMVIKASLHEINHFVLFEKWKSMHGYTGKEQPIHPEALWFLEEMAVDPTMNCRRMQETAPFPQKAYDKFYNNYINDISIEEYIINLFDKSENMADFLNSAYQFIVNNLDEIIKKCG